MLAACAHHARVVTEDPAPAPTVVTCYAGPAHVDNYFSGGPSGDTVAHLRVTISPSFSSLTEEWTLDNGDAMAFESQVDGATLAVHRRGDLEHEGIGELYGELTHPDGWHWSIARDSSAEGYTYERTGTHLRVGGEVATFEPLSSISAELDEVPCPLP